MVHGTSDTSRVPAWRPASSPAATGWPATGAYGVRHRRATSLPEVDAPFASGESVVSIQLPSNAATAQPRLTRPDVQAAVTVVGRRDTARDIRPIDLTGADLTDVRRPEGMPVPEGWLVDDKSSGLQLADELSEVTAHYL